jgi:type VI secretion system protein ImpK
VSLIEKFHTFYDELLTVEKQIAAGEMTARDARETLERHLQRQQVAAEREAGQYGVEMFVRAKYAMAALADEHLLRVDSPAKDTWIGELLESAVFKSQRAGEKVFREIDDLQADRRVGTEDLARVYLTILGLGFQGKYREVRDSEMSLEQYRHKLYRIIYGQEPPVSQLDSSKIIPGAYAATLDDADKSELPYLRPWVLALVFIFVVWIAVAHALWQSSIIEVAPLVDDIIEASPAGGAS